MNSIRAVGHRRVDRQIRRPGLEHRQNRHDRLGRTRKQQRHTLSRARALAGQQVRQPVRRLIELAGRSTTRPRRLIATASGDAGHLLGEQRRNRHRRRSPAGSTPPGCRAHPAGRAHRHRAHRSTTTARVGSAVIAANTRCNRSISASILVGVEHVGAELHRPADPGGLTGLGERSASENVRSMRAVWVSTGMLGDLQITQRQPGSGSRSCPASSARPTPPEPAGDGSAIGSG